MPSTVWSGPVPPLGIVSATPAVAAAITDISPQQTVIWPGMMQVGTRIRLFAQGNIVTSAATATVIWGFYMNAQGTSLATTPAILAASSAITVPNTGSVAWPWQLSYWGQVRALSGITGTAASVMGQGRLTLPTSLTVYAADVPIPITAALRTVAQTATGLNTNTPQTISAAHTPNVTTALTSITCDELTCELLG
jgi:hypothetical protein